MRLSQRTGLVLLTGLVGWGLPVAGQQKDKDDDRYVIKYEIWGPSKLSSQERPWSVKRFDSEDAANAEIRKIMKGYERGGILEFAPDPPVKLHPKPIRVLRSGSTGSGRSDNDRDYYPLGTTRPRPGGPLVPKLPSVDPGPILLTPSGSSNPAVDAATKDRDKKFKQGLDQILEQSKKKAQAEDARLYRVEARFLDISPPRWYWVEHISSYGKLKGPFTLTEARAALKEAEAIDRQNFAELPGAYKGMAFRIVDRSRTPIP